MITELAASVDLHAVHRGDGWAIERFVEAHQDRLYAYARSIVRDPRDAEEVVQDTLVRAIRALRFTYGEAQVRELLVTPWILRIARNLALNRVRARRSRPLTEPLGTLDPPVADLSDADSDGDHRLATALARLDTATREWLTLRFVNDCSYAEIAVVKACTESAARGRVFRALARLREELTGEDQDAM